MTGARKQWRDDATDFDTYADEYGSTVQRSIDFSGLDHDFFTRRKAQNVCRSGEPVARRAFGVASPRRGLRGRDD